MMLAVTFTLLVLANQPSTTSPSHHTTIGVQCDCAHVVCPPWFIHNETTCECQCGDQLEGIIKCNDNKCAHEIGVLDCYCMTTDMELGTVAGACFYNCVRHYDKPKKYERDELYNSLPLNLSDLNNKMCVHLKRTGRLCGKCINGYHLSAYSYDMKCVQCSKSTLHSWITYVCMAFIPLTCFFMFVLILRINVTSPRLMSYVLLAQTIATPSSIRILLTGLQDKPLYLTISKLVFSVYGVWNLDFFRTFSLPICLGINELQVLALYYAIAVYPLILVTLMYLLIQLHARGCLVLNLLWYPFKKCHTHFTRCIDAKTSIIDVFASFLLLSYVKFLCVSFDLLVPTRVYNVHGELVGIFLYYNANIAYFGPKHLPYGILAVLVVLIFIILPLLLLLVYPLKCFQKLFGNWQALRIFIDSFQGSYKDGVAEGKYDYRYFSAVFLIIRILFLLTYALTLSGYYYAVSVLLQLLLIITLVVVRPYRKVLSHYSTLDVVFMSFLGLWNASMVALMFANMKAVKSTGFAIAIGAIVGTIPVFYIPILFLKYMWASTFVRKIVLSVFSHLGKSSGNLSMGDIATVREDDANWCSGSSSGQNYGSVTLISQ